ncbi:MAG: site-specific integrase [Burkholderiaceae bacterium]
MSIRKDKKSGIWQLDIRAPSGERIRRSTDTSDRKAAQEYHDKLKASLWRQDVLGEVPDKIFEEAAVRFLRESTGQRDYDTKLRHIDYWRKQFAGRTVRSLTTDDIVGALPTQRFYRNKPPTELTGSTLNRYLSTIRRLLNLCVGWGWLENAPNLPIYFEPEVRVRWEPPEVIAKLIRAMTLPWMRDAALVAVSTGMREGELFSLAPSQIDLPQCNAWVTHEEAKSGRARSVPLNDDAVAVIERRLRTAKRFVFTRDTESGLRVGGHDPRVFERACREVGIDDFRWHDLRHTWASWHAQRGTPLMVLKELGGWETLAMVQKYAHLAPSHVAAHANTVKFWSNSEEKQKTPLSVAA